MARTRREVEWMAKRGRSRSGSSTPEHFGQMTSRVESFRVNYTGKGGMGRYGPGTTLKSPVYGGADRTSDYDAGSTASMWDVGDTRDLF